VLSIKRSFWNMKYFFAFLLKVQVAHASSEYEFRVAGAASSSDTYYHVLSEWKPDWSSACESFKAIAKSRFFDTSWCDARPNRCRTIGWVDEPGTSAPVCWSEFKVDLCGFPSFSDSPNEPCQIWNYSANFAHAYTQNYEKRKPVPRPEPPCLNQCCSATPESAGFLTSNPILPATGEKIKLQSDYTDNAPHGLDFTRTYRTAWGDVTPNSGMGSNWNHRFGMQLVNGSDSLSKTVQMPDGSQRRFTRTATTLPWVNTDGTDQLIENAAGFLFTSAQNDDKWQFNTLGKPVTLTQRNGWAYQLAYNPSGQLATVTNKFGRQLALTYNASGLVSGITTPDGQAISYQYNSTPSIIYAGYGTVSVPNSSAVQYLYENPSFPKALTGMVDENRVRSATYAYDAQGRAVSSELAGGADRVSGELWGGQRGGEFERQRHDY
jgi:YD repeat-containing protein